MSNSKGENLLNYKYYFFQVFYLVMEVERGREDGAGKQNLYILWTRRNIKV